MSDQEWKTLDTAKVIRKRDRQHDEQTTSANVGGFTVPLGGEPLRPTPPYKTVTKKKKRKTLGPSRDPEGDD